MREDIKFRFGRKVVGLIDDENPENTVYTLLELDRANEDLKAEVKVAATGGDPAAFPRKLGKYEKAGEEITWVEVGQFRSLALAFAGAKIRANLSHYTLDERLEILGCAMSLTKEDNPEPAEPADESSEEPDGESNQEQEPESPPKKKTTKKKTAKKKSS